MQEKVFQSLLKFFSFSILFLVSFFTFARLSFATTGIISGDKVNFRSEPRTGSTVYSQLNKGTSVKVKSIYAVKGNGCDTGWINIIYQKKEGYVCRNYIHIEGLETYSRPWSSPKKAIMGGAEFISSGYISRGQFNSYLKKFNVNPNGDYNIYTHQYMANLAAPYNEALSTYKSYKENNLLALPLTFTIPIFDKMPEYTTHPVTGMEKGGTSEVTDKEFEKKLDAEGFPETYKKWLRELHKTYKNWTFRSLKTGIDFNTAVENEKWISSINGNGCPKCIDSSHINTEGSWYVASSETTGYFLDPRNFLMVDSILMFEDLSYNANQTEKVVQSVLSDTFMNGTDPIDHLSYSSIFMEAGKTFQVNPVYLASLARQEVGVKGGIATSGEQFEYKGNTYVGFYNFFNIGAYSSEESPVKAGLVYASAGSQKDDKGVYVGNFNSSSNSNLGTTTNPSSPGSSNNEKPEDNKPVVSHTPVATHLSNMKLNRKGNYITNIALGTKVKDLKSMTVGSELSFKNASGGTLGDSETLTTGTKITFQTGETYTIVIYGDLNGDGKVNSADLLRMRQYLLGQVSLKDAYFESAKLQNINGKVDSADLLRLRQFLLGQKGINQA